MDKLIYSAIASADGYIEDADGKFGWAEPDDELLRLVNEVEEPIGTYLYGRRMYQTMACWGSPDQIPGDSPLVLDFARIWQAADKIVFSTTLDSPVTTRTRLEPSFDPAMIRRLKHDAHADLSVGGGKPALPAGVRLDLDLLDTRRLASGAVYLRYRTRPG